MYKSSKESLIIDKIGPNREFRVENGFRDMGDLPGGVLTVVRSDTYFVFLKDRRGKIHRLGRRELDNLRLV